MGVCLTILLFFTGGSNINISGMGIREPPNHLPTPLAESIHYLEIVEGLHLSAHRLNLVVVDGLDFSKRLAHLVLPELSVLRRRVAIRQRRQFLHLLITNTTTTIKYHADLTTNR